jgi:hypothetical protein
MLFKLTQGEERRHAKSLKLTLWKGTYPLDLVGGQLHVCEALLIRQLFFIFLIICDA